MGVGTVEELYFCCPFCGRKYEKVKMFAKERVQCTKCHHSFTTVVSNGIVLVGVLPDDPAPRLKEYTKYLQQTGEKIGQKADYYHYELEVAKEESLVNDELPFC